MRVLLIALLGLACASRVPSDMPAVALVRQVEGVVTDADQRPITGALVSVIDGGFRGVGFAVSDRAGRFSLGLPAAPVVVTATAAGHVARVLPGGGPLAFALATPSSETRRIAGMVVDVRGKPLARVRVRLMHWDWPAGAAFYAVSDDAGRFEFFVEPDGSYDLMADDPRYVSNFAALTGPNAILKAYERSWIIREAERVDDAALRGACVAGAGLADALRAARVVGLGEATHGTREFTELRSQLVGELTRNGWLTTIALEASWAEAGRVDDYVRLGKGTARDAVKALAYWPWRTEEFVAFVEAVRKRNDALPIDQKIEFVGIDYAPPEATAAYFPRLAALRRLVSWDERAKLSARDREPLLRALSAPDKPPTSLPAILGLRITQSILESRDRDDFRDRVMADAVVALLSLTEKKRHIAIWAHNEHVAEGVAEGVPMGHHLKTLLADKYRAIGTLFYEGSFVTYSGTTRKLVRHTVSVPPPHYFESLLHRVSPSAPCVLDVARAGRIRDWLAVPKHLRSYGGLEIAESYPWPPVIVPDLYSAVLFAPRTTPVTPLE